MHIPLPSLDAPFGTLSGLIRGHAHRQPDHPALRDEHQSLTYAQLDALMDRIAATLQQSGLRPGEAIAICALNSVRYAALFLGALRAGAVVAPLAPSSTANSLAAMLRDADARLLFIDETARHLVPEHEAAPRCIALDGTAPGQPFEDWLAPAGACPRPVAVPPEAAFNIIYSSGTTGTPKGIVQRHGMRWAHIRRAIPYEYGPHGTTLLATPLYSNTTLVVFLPTLGAGGCVVPHAGQPTLPDEVLVWYNQHAGKTQRLADLRFIDELPRSAIGKVLKRELREQYTEQEQGR